MPRYNGKLIFSCVDAEGAIEVVDETTARTMHFGTRARQSTMLFRDPRELALTYTRCMMISLVMFDGVPKTVLMLGLGGGSLARFLVHHYPQCRIDAVERRPAVIELARRFFELPDQRTLQVLEKDAEQFVAQQQKLSYDLLLVDLHTPEGMATANGAPHFIGGCRRLLSDGGVLAINLWSGTDDAMVARVDDQLVDAFEGQVLYLPVAGKSNVVALGLTTPLGDQRETKWRARAKTQESKLAIEFSAMLDDLFVAPQE
jgi:spermidine synthase